MKLYVLCAFSSPVLPVYVVIDFVVPSVTARISVVAFVTFFVTDSTRLSFVPYVNDVTVEIFVPS